MGVLVIHGCSDAGGSVYDRPLGARVCQMEEARHAAPVDVCCSGHSSHARSMNTALRELVLQSKLVSIGDGPKWGVLSAPE